MNGRQFKYIAVLLVCTLCCVVVLQLLWLNKLVHNSKLQQARMFTEALNSTSEELQRTENLSLLSHKMAIPVPRQEVVLGAAPKKTKTKTKKGFSFTISSSTSTSSPEDEAATVNTIDISSIATSAINQALKEAEEELVQIDTMFSDGRQSVSIRRLKHPKTKGPGAKNEEFTKISITADGEDGNPEERIQKKVLAFDTLIKTMVIDYEQKNVPLEKRVNRYTLQLALNKELLARGLDTTYEYGVFRSTRDSKPMLASGHFDTSGTHFTTELFRQDVFREKSLLMAYPADGNAYIWKDLRQVVILSSVFTLLIFGLFIVTFRAILAQKKLAQIKNDFINNMSHEFKTPIATINLAGDALRNAGVRADASQANYYIGVIKDENQKLRQHLDRILDLSLMEKQGLVMRPVDQNLVTLVQECLRDFELILKNANGRVNLVGEHLLFATLDTYYFKHAISNILDNAIKYCSLQPDIMIRITFDGTEASIRISDNGIGMSKEAQALAFEKFYRAHTGDVHNVKGFGLGLNYAKQIVEMHKGSIALESAPGKGTTVTIKLPAHG